MIQIREPELRFKADDGSEFPEWEEKRLGELFTRIVEKNRTDLSPLTIIQGQGTVRRDESDRRIAYDKKGLKNYKAVKKDDFIVHLRSFEGGLEIANQDGIVSPAYHVYRGSSNVCSQFYYPYFRSNNFIKGRLAICVTGVRDGKNIEMDTFDELLLPCPSLPEQQKIASFLSMIDEIIQSTESELTAWQERKKGVMQKIFNREVRFKADDGSEFPEWEEKRLGEVCEYGKRHGTGQNYVGTENMFSAFGGVIIENTESECNGILYSSGDILMSNIRPYLKKVWLADREGVCSTDVLVFRPIKIESEYLYCLIASDFFITKVMSAAKGSKMPRGDKKHIMEIPVSVPSLPEQRKIADCLSSLDDVINQIKAELSAWKEFKKGLLQQMFV